MVLGFILLYFIYTQFSFFLIQTSAEVFCPHRWIASNTATNVRTAILRASNSNQFPVTGSAAIRSSYGSTLRCFVAFKILSIWSEIRLVAGCWTLLLRSYCRSSKCNINIQWRNACDTFLCNSLRCESWILFLYSVAANNLHSHINASIYRHSDKTLQVCKQGESRPCAEKHDEAFDYHRWIHYNECICIPTDSRPF